MTAAIDNPMDSSLAETFAASRWTKGNFFFPTRLVISPQRVARVKSRLFGSNEESISMSKIASVHIATGVFWSEIVIESTGGTDPITSHGHRKRSEEHTSELQSLAYLVCRLLLEKKKTHRPSTRPALRDDNTPQMPPH